MIAAWMLSATLFTALLAVAAFAADRVLRTSGRPGRVPWIVALALTVTWPVVAPMLSALLAPRGTAPLPFLVPSDLPPVLSVVKVLAPAPPSWLRHLDVALLIAWGIGSLCMLARLAWAWRSIARLERGAHPVNRGDVRVVVTASLGPATFGLWRPRVLLPRWLDELDVSLRSLVVRHESEHCRAGDQQVALLGAIAVALMPWNVAAWWLLRRLRLAIELDCDARVLRVAPDVERYARLLLLIAQRQSSMRIATMLADATTDLEQRIAAMHATTTHSRVRLVAFAALAVIAIGCSTRYGRELSTAPGVASSGTASTQGGTALYYAPAGSTPARPLRGFTPPRYPDSLRLAGVEGSVVTQFVIDSSGGVVPGSIKVLSASHALFAASVQGALPTHRFTPPAVNGKNVRQLVQQSWYFDMRDGAASSQRAPEPQATPTSDPTVRSPMMLHAVVTTAVR